MLACLAFLLPIRASASGAEIHDADLERLLFGDDGVSYANDHRAADDREGRAIIALEDAGFLCIDQLGRTGYDADRGNECIQYLRKYVWMGTGIPRRLSETNPANRWFFHRSYTHQGWDYDYSANSSNATKDSQEHPQKWEARKEILRCTVDRVFGFTFLSIGWPSGHGEKCESLCALIYYVHVLGDYIAAKDYSQFFEGSNGEMIPFAIPNASDKNPDIIWELDKHLEVLFGGQTTGRHLYASLNQDLDALANRARRLAGSRSSMSEEEAYAQGRDCAIELMAILTGYDYETKALSPDHANRIHELLMNEDWFTDAFPSF